MSAAVRSIDRRLHITSRRKEVIDDGNQEGLGNEEEGARPQGGDHEEGAVSRARTEAEQKEQHAVNSGWEYVACVTACADRGVGDGGGLDG